MAEEILRVSISMNRELKDTAKELAKLRGLDMSSLVRTLLLREIELENSKKKISHRRHAIALIDDAPKCYIFVKDIIS